jgi:hypothetical protein
LRCWRAQIPLSHGYFRGLTGSRRLIARRINHLEPPQGFAELPGIDLAQVDPREIGGQESDSLERYRQRD